MYLCACGCVCRCSHACPCYCFFLRSDSSMARTLLWLGMCSQCRSKCSCWGQSEPSSWCTSPLQIEHGLVAPAVTARIADTQSASRHPLFLQHSQPLASTGASWQSQPRSHHSTAQPSPLLVKSKHKQTKTQTQPKCSHTPTHTHTHTHTLSLSLSLTLSHSHTHTLSPSLPFFHFLFRFPAFLCVP